MANSTIRFHSPYSLKNVENLVLGKDWSINCMNPEFLNLSNLRLQFLPEKFVRSDHIEAITLDDNDIAMVPSNAFDGTPNLKCLSMARNKIAVNHMKINHYGIKTLIIDDQKLSEADDLSLVSDADEDLIRFNLPNLETLSYKGANFDLLKKHLSIFPKLDRVYFSNSQLKYVNKDLLIYFPNIRIIHLENNSIENFNINCGKVEEMYLDNNPLIHFRLNQFECNLRILSLSNCLLDHSFNLDIMSLRVLDLSHNNITYIPEEMFRSTSYLSRLNLSNNKLMSFPNLENLSNLTILSLNYNLINDMHNDIIQLESLRMLGLRGNSIEHIGENTFSLLIALEYLDLSENYLRYLPPTWGENLRKLRHLNLDANYFKNIEDTMISSIVNLRNLFINNTGITSINSEALRYLPNCNIYVCTIP